MKKEREFENILDECLEKMLWGKTVEQCLTDYPDHAASLEPMLRAAARAQRATRIYPRPEFRDRARYQFQAAIRDMQPKPRRSYFPKLKPVWVTLAALAAIVVAGGGTVYAASNSLPDSPLYQIKLATESVRLALTPSELGKAELYARFADERVEEIVKMAEEGKVEQVELATERLNSQLVAIASLKIGENGAPADDQMLSFGASPPPEGGEITKTATAAQTAVEVAPAPATATETVPSVATAKPEKDGQMEAAEVVPTGEPDTALSVDAARANNTELDREARLKELLLRQAVENPEALEKALETATGSIRELLLWAIEVAGEGYEEAINNLD